MALRSLKSPFTSASASASASASVAVSGVRKPHSFNFASNPIAAAALSVDNRHSSFFGTTSTLKLNPRTSSLSSAASPSTAANRFRCWASALTPQLRETLDKLVSSKKVVLFMKGTRDFPMCGFSNTVVQILKTMNVPFEDVNILENELLRQGLKEYSNWPTFPQLYIEGEFFGGCDIALEAFQSGELQQVVEKAMCS
ncbi:PREDICTED: monothiol glutaredoxin-S14, chloroplastic-like [Tarenaya hassleriana]|uniref:monothiol glutaredoxin-S14, chloroplastic-like n=1 Tax=Tarenaya hassleriana TaxID=28532 RepID=UPI00053C1571|nr:PREDICTED: monothiol glutaredoxin-S14, chloroplastic-like [Tarenaya hassleriana]